MTLTHGSGRAVAIALTVATIGPAPQAGAARSRPESDFAFQTTSMPDQNLLIPDPLGRELPPAGSELQRHIRDLKRRLQSDDAPALHMALGVAYRLQGGLDNRIASTRQLEKALALAERARGTAGSAEFRSACMTALGCTYRDRGFEPDAQAMFERALALDPDNSVVHLELGFSMFRKWLGLGRPRGAFAQHTWDELKLAYDLDPTSTRAALGLIAIANHARNRPLAAEIARRLKDAAPLDPRTNLVEGVVAFASDEYARSLAAFQAGLRDLGPVDPGLKAALSSTSLLRPLRERHAFSNSTDSERRESDRQLWRSFDPTPTTGLNERLLEHYTRVVLADVIFAVPRLRLRGYETYLGQLLIRFGEPDVQLCERPIAPDETWETLSERCPIYPAFSIARPAPRGNANVDTPTRGGFGGGDEMPGSAFAFLYQSPDTICAVRVEDFHCTGDYNPILEVGMARLQGMQSQWLDYVSQFTRFSSPGGEFPIQGNLYRFISERGAPELEACFVIPGSMSIHEPLGRRHADATIRAEVQIALDDDSWHNVARAASSREYSNSPPHHGRRAPYPDHIRVDMSGPISHAALEVQVEDGARGLCRWDQPLVPLKVGRLELSDIVAARSVCSQDDSAPLVRSGCAIDVQAGHAFQRGDPITWYYEIYGLAAGGGEEPDVSASYRLQSRSLGDWKEWKVRLLSDWMAHTSRSVTIDTRGLPDGDYQLEATIHDRRSGMSVKREAAFTIMGLDDQVSAR